MKEFHVAAQDAVDDEQGEEKVLEFSVAGEDFIASVPTTGQIALVAGTSGGTETEQLSAVFGFLRGVLQGDGFIRLRRLIESGRVPFEVVFGGDENNASGIVEWLVQAGLGDERPTQRSGGSSSSRSTTGPRSTGRAPGKGSTRSPSQLVGS